MTHFPQLFSVGEGQQESKPYPQAPVTLRHFLQSEAGIMKHS